MINQNQLRHITYLLFLIHTLSSHAQITHTLAKLFTDLASLQAADPAALAAAGLNSEKINALKKNEQSIQHAIARELDWADQKDQHIIVLDHEEYPTLLREISGAPLLLFVKGDKKICNYSAPILEMELVNYC